MRADGARILVVEDDPTIVRTLRIALRAHGYDVVAAADGRAAVAAFQEDPPALVLLDLGLPGLDGMGVLREIRRTGAVPVVVVSARRESDDKVEALDAGADDYVTKPFGIEELLARVRAALRRSPDAQDAAVPTVRTTDFVLNFATYRAERANGEAVHLTPTEWRLLAELARRPGRVVTHQELLQAAWGPTYGRESNYLRVYANQLRRKLEPDRTSPRYLLTEPGIGYRLALPSWEE